MPTPTDDDRERANRSLMEWPAGPARDAELKARLEEYVVVAKYGEAIELSLNQSYRTEKLSGLRLTEAAERWRVQFDELVDRLRSLRLQVAHERERVLEEAAKEKKDD